MGHKTQEDLYSEFRNVLQKVRVGELYYHFKNPGKLYVVESVGFLEDTEEPCVVYRALYDKGIVWVRKLSVFLDQKVIDGKKVRRFTKVK
jgi:hypothetical protein